MKAKSSYSIYKLVLASMFLAMCMLLPFLGANIQEVLNKISPMHIPVLLCGFFCGWEYGLFIGFVAPLLRSLLFGIPVMIPNAASMAFELATYGAVSGLMYSRLKGKKGGIYISLITAMLAGRVVWGIVSPLFYMVKGKSFTFMMFLTKGFINAWPAILIQLIIIPIIVREAGRVVRKQ